MTTFVYSTTPLPVPPPTRGRRKGWLRWGALAVAAVALFLVAVPALGVHGAVTATVFAAAVAAWLGGRVDDTYVALAAALVLVLAGVVRADELFASLGDDTIWLLIAAFVLAAGIASSGLAARGTMFLIGGAATVRQLAHLLTAALVVTTFAVPATSGRAALAVPVFTALASAIDRRRVVHALALLFPTVILLSAVASLLGAGAHLVTSQILTAATGTGIGFGQWLLLGLPLAVVSSHLAAEVVLMLFTQRADRREPLRIELTGAGEPLSTAEKLAGATALAVVLLWCTTPLHGLHPALVALLGALAVAMPLKHGPTTMGAALRTVPWSLLIFMAATAVMGGALVSSGVAGWLAGTVFAPAAALPPWLFLTVVVIASTAAHLAIGSRSARSSVLVPLVIPVAIAAGVNPVLAAFASTAAAGFCHTLTSSAKPVAMFADVDGLPTYSPRDLLRLSAVLAPLHVLVVTVFAVAVWPRLGLPIHP